MLVAAQQLLLGRPSSARVTAALVLLEALILLLPRHVGLNMKIKPIWICSICESKDDVLGSCL